MKVLFRAITWPVYWLIDTLRSFGDIRKVGGEWLVSPLDSYSPIVSFSMIVVVFWASRIFLYQFPVGTKVLFTIVLYLIGFLSVNQGFTDYVTKEGRGELVPFCQIGALCISLLLSLWIHL